MHDALQLVRHELGPDAAVLHTREVQQSRMFGLLPGTPQIEVTASVEVNVPSRLSTSGIRQPAGAQPMTAPSLQPADTPEPADDVRVQIAELQKMVAELCRQKDAPPGKLKENTSPLLAELLDAELSEGIARDLIAQVDNESPVGTTADPYQVKSRIADFVGRELRVTGPVTAGAEGARVVALVGPTGVGKTTTIAKLAANLQLNDRCRVGLITADTYRIAAAEQLRTYAEIMGLPLEVAATPAELHEAVERFRNLDVVLIDTAGRSPKDDVKIGELEALLAGTRLDEIHLVVSAASGEQSLGDTARRFAPIGATALLLTKLDEATGFGGVLPLVRASGLPVSYLTHGQEVPDDIAVADAGWLSRVIVGVEE